MPNSVPILTNELFEFLERLAANNNRDWFALHKAEHEQKVRGPAFELVRRLEKPLARVAPMLSAVSKGHGGSRQDFRFVERNHAATKHLTLFRDTKLQPLGLGGIAIGTR